MRNYQVLMDGILPPNALSISVVPGREGIGTHRPISTDPAPCGPAHQMDYQEISVTDERESADRPALVQSLLRATPAEQQLLLTWSRGLGAIRQSGLSAREKAAAVVSLTREKRATWPIVKLIARALKHVVWDARSWKLRLGVGAIVATFVAVGNGAAGIVALGGDIGLPLWVLMGLGGFVAGVLADAIKKKAGKPKAA